MTRITITMRSVAKFSHRAHLSQDVHALADEAKPGNVVRPRSRAEGRGAQNLKERVFGSRTTTLYGGHSSGPSAVDRAQQFGEDARQTVQQAPQNSSVAPGATRLAAGLIALCRCAARQPDSDDSA